MMSPVRITFSAIIFLMIAVTSFVHAQTTGPQETLNEYVAELQKNPNDNALREKIIRHVQTMKPAPAVPVAVVKYEGAAEYAFKNAKNESDYLDSATEYEKALLIAPWLSIDYFNCGVAYEKAGKFRNAITYFNLYLASAPDAQDASAVRKRIGGLEYAMEKAARESSPEAVAAQEQKKLDDWLKKIDGRRYRESRGGSGELEVRGKFIMLSAPGVSLGPWEIRGRSASTIRVMQRPPLPVQTTFIISEDGDRVIEHRDFSDGNALEFVWVWQR